MSITKTARKSATLNNGKLFMKKFKGKYLLVLNNEGNRGILPELRRVKKGGFTAVVDFNPRCVRYDCTNCHGKGYVEGWIGVDAAARRCSGYGIVELWLPISITKVRENMRDWTTYTVIRPMPPSLQTTEAIFFTAKNPDGERVELRIDRDPDVVVEPKKPTEYYFNVWERPASSDQGWEWINAIQADLKPTTKRKGV